MGLRARCRPGLRGRFTPPPGGGLLGGLALRRVRFRRGEVVLGPLAGGRNPAGATGE